MTMMNTEMKIILMIMVMILMTWPPSVQWAAVSTSLELICKHGDGEELRKGGEDDDKVKEKRKLHWLLWRRIGEKMEIMVMILTKVPPQKGRDERELLRSPTCANKCNKCNNHRHCNYHLHGFTEYMWKAQYSPHKDDNHRWHHLHLPRIFIFLRSGATDNLLDSVRSSASYSGRDKA